MGRAQHQALSGFGFCLEVSGKTNVSYLRNTTWLCQALENAFLSVFAFLLCHLVSRPRTQMGLGAEAVTVTFQA